MHKLIRLIAEYNLAHGDGKGWEIFGALATSHGITGQIPVFKRAKGREIIVEPDPDHLDASDLVVVRYR